jgi:hypothetical protein
MLTLLDTFLSGYEPLLLLLFPLERTVEGNMARMRGRRVGRQAAVMMRPFSAPAHQRSSPTSKVGSLLVALARSLVHLMMAVVPALEMGS